ncbi:MAG: sodium:proline symporter [Porticoccaceae bacterium]|nr:MAG: sodium:proline symporter [Porticoccaceae bacterium]
MVASFLAFLALFAGVGLASSLRARSGKLDYYLASRSVSPWLVGLSAVATNNSGYMFIGVIGYTWAAGLAAAWLMVGWILGDLMASFFVHRRLREAAGRSQQASFAGLLAHWQDSPLVRWQRFAGAVGLIFMLAYAGAQLLAGSKALTVLLGWPPWAGAVGGAVLVALYCLAGGIRASIWTDAAQSLVMLAAMGVLLAAATAALGGPAAVVERLAAVEGYLDPWPEQLLMPGLLGLLLFVAGWLAAGLSVIGQPHIMVRFMTLDEPGHIGRARLWYYLWFAAFYAMATGVGLLSRLYLPEAAQFDAELALPLMARDLLPPLLAGLILAGIFAATLSTADSLLLGCSAAITHDLLPRGIERPVLLRAVTLAVTLGALAWALASRQTVFALVILAWSGLACTFGPVLLILALGGRMGEGTAIAVSAAGLAAAVGWRAAGLAEVLYEGLPGMLAALAVYALARAGGPEWKRSRESGVSTSDRSRSAKTARRAARSPSETASANSR